jgi:hypothetical protein
VVWTLAPKVHAGGSPGLGPIRWGSEGSIASLRWDTVTNRSRGSQICLRVSRDHIPSLGCVRTYLKASRPLVGFSD